MTTAQISAANLADWRQLAQALHARFRTGNFATGAAFVAAITDAAEAGNHHPEVTLTYPFVELRLLSHDVGGLTQRDVDLARQISAIAADRGIAADPAAVVQLELGLDTADYEKLGPFWADVLGHTLDDRDVMGDGTGAPNLWFQSTEPHETPRQRFHLDLWVAPETVRSRVDSAVAAGGTVTLSEESFTVVADPDGNKVCFCSIAGR